MKKMFFLLFILAGTISSYAQFTNGKLIAAGLTCAMCSKAINNSLEKLPFVSKVKSDIKTSSFIIDFSDDKPVDIDQVRKAVEDAGFSIAKLSLTGNFQNLSVGNDAHVQIAGKNFHFLNVSKQTLNGTKTITLLDKNFIPAKEFKKVSASTKYACIQTGKAESCCTKEGISGNARIYHVTI